MKLVGEDVQPEKILSVFTRDGLVTPVTEDRKRHQDKHGVQYLHSLSICNMSFSNLRLSFNTQYTNKQEMSLKKDKRRQIKKKEEHITQS